MEFIEAPLESQLNNILGEAIPPSYPENSLDPFTALCEVDDFNEDEDT